MSEPQTHETNPGKLVADAAPKLRGAAPESVLAWALSNFSREKIGLCSSLQDEGMVILDMAWRIDPGIQVFTIDTGRLPAATLDLMEEVRGHYGIRLEILFPDADEVSAMVSEHGVNLFYESTEFRLGCCDVRKAHPLNRRLASLDAWITGLRQDQNQARRSTAEVEIDEAHSGIVKINPLANWTRDQVLGYIAEHDVPRNAG